MQSARYSIGGRTVYECKGVVAYTLNVLSGAGVRVREVKVMRDCFRFSVAVCDSAKVKSLLEGARRDYRIIEEKSLFLYFKNFILRYTFIAGLVVSLALTYVYSTLITGVRVGGNDLVSSESIEEVVNSMIAMPSFFTSPDFEEVEKRLVSLDGVAYAKVRKSGCEIVVEIVEELPVTEITDTQNPIALLATECGTITKVVALRGTPSVKVGDVVTAGQELVAPYVIGEGETRLPVRAMGIVEARVVREESVEYSAESLMDSEIAGEIERRIGAYKEGLKEGEKFLGSSFELKKLDKSTIISIYYEIITRIS